MSEIMSALRVMQLERADNYASMNAIPSPIAAMTVSASNFAAFEEFGALRAFDPEPIEERPVASQTPPQLVEFPVTTPAAAAAEAETTSPAQETVAQQLDREPSPTTPAAFTVNASDFLVLEERIAKAVELVRLERQQRMAAEERASQAEAAISAQVPRIAEMSKELHCLKNEREHGRQRLEKMLFLLDTL